MQAYWEKIYDWLMNLLCILRNVAALSMRQMALILRILRHVHNFTCRYLLVSDSVIGWSPSFNSDRILFSFLKFACQLRVSTCYFFVIKLGSKFLWQYVLSCGRDVPWTRFVVVEIILIFEQRDATQSSLFIILQVHSICFGCQPHPSSGLHKTVTTASGTGHMFVQLTPSNVAKLAWL